MGRMLNSPHPASIILEDVLPELGLTVTEAARQLGMSRVQLSRVLNERAGISPDLAMRLEQWLGGPSAESWLHMQVDYVSRPVRLFTSETNRSGFFWCHC